MATRKKREEYQETRRIIINVQQNFRAKLLGCQEKHKFKQQKNPINQFQRKFRRKLFMEREKSQYLLLRKSTIVIQKIQSLEADEIRKIEIQRKFRTREFLVLKESFIRERSREDPRKLKWRFWWFSKDAGLKFQSSQRD